MISNFLPSLLVGTTWALPDGLVQLVSTIRELGIGCLSRNFASVPLILYIFSVRFAKGVDAEGCSHCSLIMSNKAGRKEILGGGDRFLLISPKMRSSSVGAGSSTRSFKVLARRDIICEYDVKSSEGEGSCGSPVSDPTVSPSGKS